MRILKVNVDDECERQKDEAENGNNDPVNVAEEIREEPQKDDCKSWKGYSQQREQAWHMLGPEQSPDR